MNCYDFDKTIYKKDSSIAFFLFCMKKKPRLIFNFIKSIFYLILNKFGIMSTEKFKSHYFSFVKYLENVNDMVNLFWNQEIKNINEWYYRTKRNTDVICSASPEFILIPLFKKINSNATIIATKIDLATGKIVGNNIKGEQKVEALKEHFNTNIIEFNDVYTDSMSDLPILDLAQNKYIIGKKGNIYPFGKQRVSLLIKLKYVIKQLRMKHYIKNGLIFLPLFFSTKLTNISDLIACVSSFISFCFIASMVYVINDLLDARKDRLHKKKRKRPIACYMIKPYEAVVMAITLFIMSIGLSILTFGMDWLILFILIGYALINFAYSLYLKHLPIVDVFTLASCYLIRLFYGSIVIDVELSNWLFLTVLCGALFMGFGKRRNELKQQKNETRKVNRLYTQNFLDKNMYIAMAMCLVFYSLWAIDFKNMEYNQFNRILLLSTIPIIYFIMMKYSLNIENENNDGEPIDVLLKDYVLIATVLVFLIFIIFAVYIPISITMF